VILAIALNPALDLTYELDERLRVGRVNRVAAVHVRPGGKALNVARVLSGVGRVVTVVGPRGGATGESLAATAAAHGIDARWVPIAGETRRTVAIWEHPAGEVTMLNEPGPRFAAADWQSLLAAVEAVGRPKAMVLSGSLPPGVPDDAYATLIRVGSAMGAMTFIDTDGPGLLSAVATGPSVVKLNREELAAATGVADDLLAGATFLHEHGAEVVVVTDGSRGLLGVTPAGAWWARPPVVGRGNPTGAGDAALAGLVATCVDGRTWAERLRHAAAWGARAAATPVAGEIGPLDQVEGVIARTTVEEL
jgi:1-phosphofructokinase family hexose kinase